MYQERGNQQLYQTVQESLEKLEWTIPNNSRLSGEKLKGKGETLSLFPRETLSQRLALSISQNQTLLT
jgi:hypothetical protein